MTLIAMAKNGIPLLFFLFEKIFLTEIEQSLNLVCILVSSHECNSSITHFLGLLVVFLCYLFYIEGLSYIFRL